MGSGGQLEWSESQLEGSKGQLEGSEGQLDTGVISVYPFVLPSVRT